MLNIEILTSVFLFLFVTKNISTNVYFSHYQFQSNQLKLAQSTIVSLLVFPSLLQTYQFKLPSGNVQSMYIYSLIPQLSHHSRLTRLCQCCDTSKILVDSIRILQISTDHKYRYKHKNKCKHKYKQHVSRQTEDGTNKKFRDKKKN